MHRLLLELMMYTRVPR
uniref:Uncharacterized protein n=1 Tax=Lotus japonicus TaxID=34305 RepID=I3SWQ5_LOTJA|nr:unknown [Lotus japonicus]